jgi:iron-sulfur cluster assembly accessory protein
MPAVTTFDQSQVLAVTPEVVRHLGRHMAKKPGTIGVHIGVRDSGCSGYAYVLELVDTQPSDTVRIDADPQLTLFVDVKSIPALSGSTLRLVKEGLNETVKFDNPNAGSYCGCGESFTVNPEVAAKLQA